MLRLAPGVVAFQAETQFDAAAPVRYDLFARREGLPPSTAAFYMFGAENTDDAFDVLWTLYAKMVSEAESGWWFPSSFTQPLANVDFLRLCISNVDGEADMFLDDLVVVEEPEPTVPHGHLLRAEHYGMFTIFPGEEEGRLWVPLPLDHGVQVPLYVELTVEPEGLVSAVEYSVDEIGNLGAILVFAPDAQQVGAVVRWDAVVLTLEQEEAALAEFYAPIVEPDTWLADTPVVQMSHEGIAGASADAVMGLDDLEEQMVALLGISSSSIYLQGMPDGLDAANAFESHMGSCTSFANLGAALGRAAGIPTRTIANYLVGMSQQTHSINEFYLGPDKGWRLVEPQSTAASVPGDYAVVVRVDWPDPDEGPAAMESTPWSYPGVPLLSLVRPLAAHARFKSLIFTEHFPDCDTCDNRADYQAPLEGEAAKVRAAFDDARALWQESLTAWTTTGPDPSELEKRREFMNANSLDDVQTLLDSP